MRTLSTAAMLGLVAICSATARADDAQKGAWLDAKNCAVCKHLSDDPALLKNLTWEVHPIENGMIMIASAPKEQLKALAAASEKMKAAGQKMKEGEKGELCGFCQSYGSLLKAGAKEQEVKTAIGMVHLLTSEDPQVVKQIHEHAKRTQEEQKKMMAHKSAA